MQNSVAIEDCIEGSLPNNQPLLPTTMSVIIPELFWKGIKCCTRLAYLEVIVVPLRLIQLELIGCDIHDQRLGACTTLVYCLCHTPPGISFTVMCITPCIGYINHAHPKHLKVLKHFVYIQYGCGMLSMGVCSLNHDTTTSYRLGHTPFSLKIHPHLHM
jgi:hypothetical protein